MVSGATPETTRRRRVLPQMPAVVFQMGEDFFVGGGEGEFTKLGRRQPDTVVFGGASSASPKIFGRRGTPPSELNAKRFERDAIARNRMFYGAKRLKGWRAHAETFCGADNFQIGLPDRSSRRQSALTFLAGILSGLIPLCGTATWAWINFRVRKFPQVRIHDTGGPLADEETSLPLDHKRQEMPGRAGGAFAEVRQFSDAVFAKRDAEFFHRANRALRLAGCADQGAEFHQRLVQV